MQIQLPFIKQAFYKPTDMGKNAAELAKIRTNYGAIINNIAAITKVPEKLIVSMIFIESGGDDNAVNGYAIGLMQIDYRSAGDIIFFENKQKRLGETEKTLLRKYIGSRLDCVLSMRYMGDKIKCNSYKGYSFTKTDLLKPELNILIGAIYLGILLDDHTEKGIVRLDKLVLRYNKGFFTKFASGATKEQIYASASTTSKNYIAKLSGYNSILATS